MLSCLVCQDEIADFLGSVITQSPNGIGTDSADFLAADNGTKRKPRKRKLAVSSVSDVNNSTMDGQVGNSTEIFSDSFIKFLFSIIF